MSKSPEMQEFVDNLAKMIFGASPSESPNNCISCKEPFSDKNVYTDAGWRETKISGLCEKCFDAAFEEQ